jgi:hypothetical protein
MNCRLIRERDKQKYIREVDGVFVEKIFLYCDVCSRLYVENIVEVIVD